MAAAAETDQQDRPAQRLLVTIERLEQAPASHQRHRREALMDLKEQVQLWSRQVEEVAKSCRQVRALQQKTHERQEAEEAVLHATRDKLQKLDRRLKQKERSMLHARTRLRHRLAGLRKKEGQLKAKQEKLQGEREILDSDRSLAQVERLWLDSAAAELAKAHETLAQEQQKSGVAAASERQQGGDATKGVVPAGCEPKKGGLESIRSPLLPGFGSQLRDPWEEISDKNSDDSSSSDDEAAGASIDEGPLGIFRGWGAASGAVGSGGFAPLMDIYWDTASHQLGASGLGLHRFTDAAEGDLQIVRATGSKDRQKSSGLCDEEVEEEDSHRQRDCGGRDKQGAVGAAETRAAAVEPGTDGGGPLHDLMSGWGHMDFSFLTSSSEGGSSASTSEWGSGRCEGASSSQQERLLLRDDQLKQDEEERDEEEDEEHDPCTQHNERQQPYVPAGCGRASTQRRRQQRQRAEAYRALREQQELHAQAEGLLPQPTGNTGVTPLLADGPQQPGLKSTAAGNSRAAPTMHQQQDGEGPAAHTAAVQHSRQTLVWSVLASAADGCQLQQPFSQQATGHQQQAGLPPPPRALLQAMQQANLQRHLPAVAAVSLAATTCPRLPVGPPPGFHQPMGGGYATAAAGCFARAPVCSGPVARLGRSGRLASQQQTPAGGIKPFIPHNAAAHLVPLGSCAPPPAAAGRGHGGTWGGRGGGSGRGWDSRR